MKLTIAVFISTYTTLLAIINPLEALPVFLSLMGAKDKKTQLSAARRSCLYATALMFFFLIFGELILRLFGVPLSMVRVVGGIILVKIGFELFSPTGKAPLAGGGQADDDVAFVPMAMPIMFGPGAIATILGMISMGKVSEIGILHVTAIAVAMVLTMFTVYLFLAYADAVLARVGPKGIDAATRI